MIFISILSIIVAIALPSSQKAISSLITTRISSIIFIYSGALAINALNIQSIGSGIGIFSGLFHVTIISQLIDVLLLLVSGMILVSWPLISQTYYNKVNQLITLFKDSSSSLSPLFLQRAFFPSSPLESDSQITFKGFYTPRTEYSIIVLFSGLGSTLLISSSDLLSMYLSIELQSFGLYILACLYKDYETSTASSIKYFLLGALSSCFILLGFALIYSYTGLTNLESIYSLIAVFIPFKFESNYLILTHTIIRGVTLGLIFIFIGFLFKIAAAPFHSWSPDVYDETQTQVTIWLTIIPKIAILIVLLELVNGFSITSPIELDLTYNILDPLDFPSKMYLVSNNISSVIRYLLLIIALISLLVGTIVGLAQTRIKRLLAYSTISHLGFILLALAINSEQSTDSYLFYIIQYTLTNLNIFLIIIAFGYILNTTGIKTNSETKTIYWFDYDISYLSSFRGQYYANIILSLCLMITLLSMTGIPPLVGFFSKQFVLLSAVESKYYFMAFIAIFTSVISASYYIRFFITLISSPADIMSASLHPTEVLSNKSILTNYHSYIISTLTLSILTFIFKPTLILNSTQLLSLSYFYI